MNFKLLWAWTTLILPTIWGLIYHTPIAVFVIATILVIAASVVLMEHYL